MKKKSWTLKTAISVLLWISNREVPGLHEKAWDKLKSIYSRNLEPFPFIKPWSHQQHELMVNKRYLDSFKIALVRTNGYIVHIWYGDSSAYITFCFEGVKAHHQFLTVYRELQKDSD